MIFNVTYSAYKPNSGQVVSEGTMPVNTSQSNLAEQTVRSMFPGCEVMIRYVTQ